MAFKIGLNVLCINLYLIREITIAANPLIILIFIYLFIYCWLKAMPLNYNINKKKYEIYIGWVC